MAGLLLPALLGWMSSSVASSATLTAEPDGQAYSLVTHYRVSIDADAERVWDALIDFRSWMVDFELTTVSGSPGAVGYVARLYPGQGFLIEIVAAEPRRMLAIVNLPIDFNGESGTGVAILTLHQCGNSTEMSLTMSRRYVPVGEGFRDSRAMRQSDEFQEATRAMWEDRFLVKLKSIAEGDDAP